MGKSRNKEIIVIIWTYLIMGINILIIFTLSPALVLATFSIFFSTGHTISLAQGFAALQVLGTLNMPIRWIPGFVGTLLQFTVSMRRIQKFLICDEVNPAIVEHNSRECRQKDLDILVEDSSFSWGGLKDDDKKQGKPSSKKEDSKEETKGSADKVDAINEGSSEDLDSSQASTTSNSEEDKEEVIRVEDSIQVKNLDLKIHKGEFVCVIGGVGSGKSSLISALLGDMIYMDEDTIEEFKGKKIDDTVRHQLIERSKQHKGKIKLGGSLSYVQQTPWIQNKTIRDNILFGLPMDEDKYNRVIEL